MQGVNCLQDLKQKLIQAGHEIWASEGWYLVTAAGHWTMSFGHVYLNLTPIKKFEDLPEADNTPRRRAKKIMSGKLLDLSVERV
jgi:hypothetical protein